MKLLLFILTLTLYHHVSAQSPILGGYNPIDPSELNQDQKVQDILAFGAHYVVAKGIKDQALPETNYKITKIYSADRQVVSGLNYKFDVQIRNDKGTKIRASYVVYDQSWTKTRKVSSYSYQIGKDCTTGAIDNLDFLPVEIYRAPDHDHDHDSVVGGYTKMDLSKAKHDPQLRRLLHFAVKYITKQEASAHKIPVATYAVSKIHSVWTQVVSGVNYRFDVDIRNKLGWVLRVTFVVYSQPWTKTREVTSYVYSVTTNPNPSEEEEEFVLPQEEDINGGYAPIDPSELDTDSDLKNALQVGVRDIVDQAVIDHALPDSTYKVSRIHSIFGQVVSGMNYRFNVDIKNCADLVARAVFTVYSEPWTNTTNTTPGGLHITDIPDEGLIGGDCSDGSGDGDSGYSD